MCLQKVSEASQNIDAAYGIDFLTKEFTKYGLNLLNNRWANILQFHV